MKRGELEGGGGVVFAYSSLREGNSRRDILGSLTSWSRLQ